MYKLMINMMRRSEVFGYRSIEPKIVAHRGIWSYVGFD